MMLNNENNINKEKNEKNYILINDKKENENDIEINSEFNKEIKDENSQNIENKNKEEKDIKEKEVKDNNEIIKEDNNEIKNSKEKENNLDEEKKNENLKNKKEINNEKNQNETEKNNKEEEDEKNQNEEEEKKVDEKKEEKENKNKDFEEYENWADAPIEDSSDEEEEEEETEKKNEKLETQKEDINKNNNENEINIKSGDNKENNNKDELKTEENSKDEIQKLLNAISLNNYHEIKNKLKPLLNNNITNQEFFIEFLYKYSLEQLSYQKIYSNLFNDIYLYLHKNKNNLKFFRKKIIEKCKQNLITKKIIEENRNIINNNICLIAELINSKIFPKKTGLKCLKYLICKYEKYSELNEKNTKYMYLECILFLLNTFCSNIYNYQKERTHEEFDKEIKKIIEILIKIKDEENNKDIPLYTKHLLLQLIEKAEKKWELPQYEKDKFESHFKVFNNGENMIENNDDENNKSFNDSSFIKQDEIEQSFEEEKKSNKIIFNDGIEREIDKKENNKYMNNNQNKNDFYMKGKYNQNNNENWKQNDKYNNNDYKNNKNYYNKINYYNNSNNKDNNNNNNNNNYYYKYNSTNINNNNINNNNNNNYYRYNSNTTNSNNFKKYNNYNNKYKKNNSNDNDSFYSSSNSINNSLNNNNINYNNNTKNNANNYNQSYTRNNYSIILNNLKQFKRHLDNNNNNSANNFNWNDINNLFNSKISMNIFMEDLIQSCIIFTINNDSFYYIDLYLQSIFNFYSKYFSITDINDIKDVVIKHLKKLDNNLNYDKNYYLEDIWVIFIYYLINNQILSISEFNIFNREYNNIKKEIANVLNKVVDYNYESKNYILKELKNSKFYNDNRKIFE